MELREDDIEKGVECHREWIWSEKDIIGRETMGIDG